MARPKGSPNVRTVQQVEAPRCPDCQCTEARVLGTTTQDDHNGLTGDGKPFNRIVRRRMQCDGCSRVWISRSLEYVP